MIPGPRRAPPPKYGLKKERIPLAPRVPVVGSLSLVSPDRRWLEFPAGPPNLPEPARTPPSPRFGTREGRPPEDAQWLACNLCFARSYTPRITRMTQIQM